MIPRSLTKMPVLWVVLAIVYAGIFGGILFFAYSGKLPTSITQYDKPLHVFLYFMATFLGHMALNRRRLKMLGYAVPLFPFLFSLFTIAEELIQSLSPNRSLDFMDLVASLAGILLGFWLAEKRGNKSEAKR